MLLPPWLIPYGGSVRRNYMRAGSLTATEDEIRNTPPSGFLLNMGPTCCTKTRWDITLVAQHLHTLSARDYGSKGLRAYLVPLVMTQVVKISESREPGPTRVVDDYIKAAELLDTFFYESDCILNDSNVLFTHVRD